jgi:hypothetical protein
MSAPMTLLKSRLHSILLELVLRNTYLLTIGQWLCRPSCRGTACRTLLVRSRDENEEGTASRTPTTGQCRVTIVKNWMLQRTRSRA